MAPNTGDTFSAFLDLLYPPICLVCGEDVSSGCMCSGCIEAIRPVLPPYCERCGEPVTRAGILCDRCREIPAPAYDWSQAPYQYDGVMLRAIHRLKYDRKEALALPLGEMLADSLSVNSPLMDANRDPAAPAFDLVIPAPLHAARLRSRGFNQAELLAERVCLRYGWRLEGGALSRMRHTPSQTALSHDERAHNMRGAFVVRLPSLVERRHILLIDDVLTSTSTAREMASALVHAGASRVCVLALARSI